MYIKKKRRRKLLEDKRLNFFSVKIYLLPVKNLNFWALDYELSYKIREEHGTERHPALIATVF